MCALAVRNAQLRYVPDARLEPAFADNPWVDGRAAEIRFYASAPLLLPDIAVANGPEQRVRQGAATLRADVKPQSTGPLEFMPGDIGVEQVIDVVHQDPGPIPHLFADERAVDAPPDPRPATAIGPDGNNARRGVPAPKPFTREAVHVSVRVV